MPITRHRAGPCAGAVHCTLPSFAPAPTSTAASVSGRPAFIGHATALLNVPGGSASSARAPAATFVTDTSTPRACHSGWPRIVLSRAVPEG